MAEELEEEFVEFGSDKKSDDFELIAPGVYEVTIERIDKKTSNKNGKTTDYLNFTFVIRDDVEQNFRNRKVWYTVFRREGEKFSNIAYDFKTMNLIITTQENKPDYKRHFSDIDEIIQYLVGAHMTVEIVTEFSNYKNADVNEIKDRSFGPSEWDQAPHAAPTTETAAATTEISDDDLPF